MLTVVRSDACHIAGGSVAQDECSCWERGTGGPRGSSTRLPCVHSLQVRCCESRSFQSLPIALPCASSHHCPSLSILVDTVVTRRAGWIAQHRAHPHLCLLAAVIFAPLWSTGDRPPTTVHATPRHARRSLSPATCFEIEFEVTASSRRLSLHRHTTHDPGRDHSWALLLGTGHWAGCQAYQLQ